MVHRFYALTFPLAPPDGPRLVGGYHEPAIPIDHYTACGELVYGVAVTDDDDRTTCPACLAEIAKVELALDPLRAPCRRCQHGAHYHRDCDQCACTRYWPDYGADTAF
jgi:hypothetical protein